MAASLETAPLLRQASLSKATDPTPNGNLQSVGTIPAGEGNGGSETTWKIETQLLARYSAPLVVTYMLQYSYSFVTVLVAGRLGTSELAAASLASMTANITGLAIYEGLATSLDTLTSQAFGAGRKQLVGLHVQRMIALSLLVTIPIGAIWMCSPWILARLVPEQKVAYLAGDFLRFYLIGAPAYGVFEAVKRFTQAQGNFTGPMVTALICAPLNIFWNWLLVFVSHQLGPTVTPTDSSRNLGLVSVERPSLSQFRTLLNLWFSCFISDSTLQMHCNAGRDFTLSALLRTGVLCSNWHCLGS